jgi:hypothetical protein
VGKVLITEVARCPSCGGSLALTKYGDAECTRCAQRFDDREFYAHGDDAMAAQVAIVNYYHKMATLRAIASYGASAVFACVAAALIVFAPENRTVGANVVAGAFVILAAGIAGFTRFRAKAPGLDVSGDQARPKSN